MDTSVIYRVVGVCADGSRLTLSRNVSLAVAERVLTLIDDRSKYKEFYIELVSDWPPKRVMPPVNSN